MIRLSTIIKQRVTKEMEIIVRIRFYNFNPGKLAPRKGVYLDKIVPQDFSAEMSFLGLHHLQVQGCAVR